MISFTLSILLDNKKEFYQVKFQQKNKKNKNKKGDGIASNKFECIPINKNYFDSTNFSQ